MKIKFMNNRIKLSDFNSNESVKANQLSIKLREDFTDWSSEVRNKPIIKNKTKG